MAIGSVSSLGVGSGFELQKMLTDLRAADEVSLNIKKAQKTRLAEQVVEFDSLNAKILQMKSDALSLSLASNFLERKISTDDLVATATVQSGTALSSHSLTVDRLASKSSWQAQTGATGPGGVMYARPTTALTDFSSSAVTEETLLSFTIEHETGQKSISLTLPANASIQDIVTAINSHEANMNGVSTYVTATAQTGETGSYIRLSATDTDSTKNNRILVSQGPEFIAPDLGFSYQVGSANDPVYVSVPPGTSYETLVSLVNKNANNPGMKAAMINTGIGITPWHLTFTAKETGENSRITLAGDIAMTQIQGSGGAGSLNAAFSIDGYGYQRQSNSGIDDIIQGVSFTLKKTDSTQVTISSSAEALKEKITSLITTYNEINGEIDSKTRYSADEESKDGILSNIYAVKTIDSVLFDLLGTIVNTGTKIKSLADLGMQMNRDGTITLDQSDLDTAFASSLDEVTALFIGDKERGIKGLGDILNDKLRSMSHSSTGVVNAEKSGAQEKINDLTASIEAATARLDKKYELMASQFIQLDAFIGRMNSQASYLTSMLDSFNNTNKTQ